jgi:excisionase family DNA binding protein
VQERKSLSFVPLEGAVLPELMTTDEVAEYLRKSRGYLDANAERLGIPRIKIGKHYRYRLADVNVWLESLKVGG